MSDVSIRQAEPTDAATIHELIRALAAFEREPEAVRATPESIAQQIPGLRELLALREALTELKGPLSQNAEFRKRLQKLLDDETERGSILDEIGLGSSVP